MVRQAAQGPPPARATIPVSVRQGKSLWPEPAKNVPFFTPAQDPPAGTALGFEDGRKGPLPKIFTPLQIRGVKMPNRIWMSPMCQYSAHEGFHTPWHTTHYGGMLQRGVSRLSLAYIHKTSGKGGGKMVNIDRLQKDV